MEPDILIIEINRKGFEMANVMRYLEDLCKSADEAGKSAVAALEVQPMVVQDQRTGQQWLVGDGVCGFAWVNLKPGNCALAKYMKNNKIARTDSYNGGVQIWVSAYGQSMQKKEAYAYAYAEVLKKDGYKAYAGSRMD